MNNDTAPIHVKKPIFRSSLFGHMDDGWEVRASFDADELVITIIPDEQSDYELRLTPSVIRLFAQMFRDAEAFVEGQP